VTWNARSAGLASATGSARDLLALRLALEQIPALKQILNNVAQASRLPGHQFQELHASFSEPGSPETGGTPALLSELAAQLGELPDLIELISAPLWTNRRSR